MYPQRPPASIKVLGILNLVFAGFGMLGLLFTYAMYFGGLKLGPRNPVVELAHEKPDFMLFMKVSLGLGIVAVIVLGVCGIGLIGMRAWARKLAIGYAIYGIISSLAGLVITYSMILAPLANKPGGGAGVFGGLWGGILGCAYPCILLAFMLKRNVAEAFARANPAPVELPAARVHRE